MIGGPLSPEAFPEAVPTLDPERVEAALAALLEREEVRRFGPKAYDLEVGGLERLEAALPPGGVRERLLFSRRALFRRLAEGGDEGGGRR